MTVSIFEKGDNYIISVKNYIEESVLARNETLKTFKSDKSFHGLGLKNVRSIVKLAKAFGNETSSKKIINNYMDIKHNINVSDTKTDNNNSPTFFV